MQKLLKNRKCMVCSKKFNVTLLNGNRIPERLFFTRMEIPVGKGKNVKVGTKKIGNMQANIVKWTGKYKKIEYWECENCNKED